MIVAIIIVGIGKITFVILKYIVFIVGWVIKLVI